MVFTKGHKAYNKGQTGVFHHSEEAKDKMSKSHTGKTLTSDHKRHIGESNIGRVFSKETRKKIGDAQRGELHNNWKGDDVKYRGLHTWITKNYGKADHCEMCDGLKAKVFDWANISGEYRRDREDWEQLCRKCHMLKDGRMDKIKATQFRKKGL